MQDRGNRDRWYGRCAGAAFLSVVLFLTNPCGAQAPLKPQDADGIVGAEHIIDAAKKAAEKNAPADEAVADESLTWQEQLERFRADQKELGPQEAASRWLDIALRGLADEDNWQVFGQAVSVLPGPDSWPSLEEKVLALPVAAGLTVQQKLRVYALRIFVQTLNNDQDAVGETMATIKGLVGTLPQEAQGEMSDTVAALKAAINRQERGGNLRDLDGYRAYIEMCVKRYREWGDLDSVPLADLVDQFGEEEAQAFLVDALKQPVLLDTRQSGTKTQALAQRLMMQHIDKLAVAQWYLVGDKDTIQVYEALVDRFNLQPAANDEPGAAGPDLPEEVADEISRLRQELGELRTQRSGTSWAEQSARAVADRHYLEALLAAGRDDKIKVLLAKMLKATSEDHVFYDYDIFSTFEDADQNQKLWEIINELLVDAESVPAQAWQLYASMGEKRGETDAVVQRLDALLDKDPPAFADNPEALAGLLATRYQVLLAAGRLDPAVAAIRKAMSAWPSKHLYENPGSDLVELGLLFDKAPWVDEGLAWMADDKRSTYYREDLIALSEDAGRYAQVERLLKEQLITAVKERAGLSPLDRYQRSSYFDLHSGTDAALFHLTTFYHRIGRHEDALRVLTEAPWWSVDDLAALLKQSSYDSDLVPLVVASAAALADAGRAAEARACALSAIALAPDDDDAYAVYVSLSGEAGLARLDAIYLRDQFEERPLIWKAHLLNTLRRHPEAAEVAKRAIAIDPSDGDQGKGDRMRVYEVLADALAGMGKDEEEAFYREVVAAIRLSEYADDLYSIGMRERATELYQRALNRFADAYCIQSRLALRLYSAGKVDEAAEHYRRAFELMPDSFGRVESHCFGCEGVFSSDTAQQIAEDVFTGMLKERPGKPQLHYLLGYLRSSQGREAEAYIHFKNAVELDPDYVNAWRRISSSSYTSELPPEEQDEIVFNMLRVDPLRRHASANTQDVYDLARLWRAVEQGLKLQPEPPEKLLALASTPLPEPEQLDPEMAMQLRWIQQQQQQMMSRNHRMTTPAQLIAEHRVVQAVNELIQMY